MKRKTLRSLVVGGLLLLPIIAVAGSFTVIPIRIYLTEKKKTESLKIKNNGASKVTVQIESFLWGQDKDGQDIQEPTKDLIYFPKILEIGPNEERIVRLSYSGNWPVTEKTYRLYVREIPVSEKGVTGLSMALRIGLPVFISPPQEKGEFDIEEAKTVENALQVRVRNLANHHIMVKKITVLGLDAAGKTAFTNEIAGWYVLANVSKLFSMDLSPDDLKAAKTLNVLVQSETMSRKATLKVPER